MTALIALIGGVRATVFLAAALLLATAAGVQSCRLESARERAATLDRAVASYRDAQATNLGTIKALRDRMAANAARRRTERAQAARAAAEAAAEATRINAALAAVQAELEGVYAKSPEARAWGAAGVDRDVLDRLPGAGASAH